MPTPWVYLRREIAREWGIKPWEVESDELRDELSRLLELWKLEREYAVPAQRGPEDAD